MRFRPRAFRDEPEINFIPLIDVLLVILIFLMVTTTYSRYAELKINLPTADAPKAQERTDQIDVAVNAQGQYAINRSPIQSRAPEVLSEQLRRAAGDMKDPVVIISADGNAPHQAVITIMEAARIAGYGKITFTTQAKGR